MTDSFRHQGMRKRLMMVLAQKGITNQRVLAAMQEVPRHLFVEDSIFLKHAYENKAFPIGAGQTISHPYTVAVQSSILDIKKGDKVLEIGTGSGYQTAVLLELGAKVYSIERQKELYLKTKTLLQKLNYRADLKYGDGFKGWPSFGPYDKIIITCGAPYTPKALIDQLKPGGIMIIPLTQDTGIESMTCIKKEAGGTIETKTIGDFQFVPMLQNRAR